MMGSLSVFVWGLAVLVCLSPVLNYFKGGVLAFHKVSKHLQHISAFDIKQVHRTGYHFQPKKHWINGIYTMVIILICSMHMLSNTYCRSKHMFAHTCIHTCASLSSSMLHVFTKFSISS